MGELSMALQEANRHRRQGERASQPDDHRVLSLRQWCEVNGISISTGRRIIESGNGPTFLQLSARRIGVTVAANRAWQESRARSA
jgi:predicted DNA-binding transcriptional regulator AlpA